jgi:hypothetical protein
MSDSKKPGNPPVWAIRHKDTGNYWTVWRDGVGTTTSLFRNLHDANAYFVNRVNCKENWEVAQWTGEPDDSHRD